MPDRFENVIYKLSIDGEGYIVGTEALAASTARFTQEQERANNTLKTNEAALKVNTDRLAKAKADLEAYTGTNARYRKQLEGDVKSAERDQQKLTELVNNNRIAYEKATKAASDFAQTSARASQLSQGGKIPTPTIVQPVIPNLGAGIQDALKGISLGDLPEALSRTIPEFETLRGVIEQAKARMNELNAEDEEFKQLAPIVKQGEEALRLYDQAVKTTDTSQKSLRTRLREGREELVRMEQAMSTASSEDLPRLRKEYFELEKSVAKLTDEFADQQARIRILASDTKLLDFGKGAITAATSAFQVYASVSILAGDQSERLQKLTMQLFAAMQLLQALEQLSNLTRREGVLATLAQSAAQSVYTAVVGTSTGALKAFRLALLATGIGAAVVAIGFLVKRYIDLKEANERANREHKLQGEIFKEAANSVSKEVAQLEIFRKKLNDTSLTESERVRVAKEYNKVADEQNKIDLRQIDNLKSINEKIDAQNKLIIQRAIATAATSKIGTFADKVIEADLKLQEALKESGQTEEQYLAKNKNFLTNLTNAFKAGAGPLSSAQTDLINTLGKNLEKNNLSSLFLDRNAAKEALDEAVNSLSSLITTDTKKGGGGGGGKSAAENVFEQERQKQRERLAELLRKSVEDEKTIRAQFEQQLISEKQRIDDLLKDKKLTPKQAETLKIEAAKINTVELDKALEDFRKKVSDARKKINDELSDLEQKAIQDSINLLSDEFEKRKQLIDINEKQEIEDSKKNTQERLDSLELDRLLLGEDAYQKARAQIVSVGEKNILNIEGKAAKERQDLAADLFKKSLDVTQQILDEQLTQLDETTAGRIKQQKALLDAGTINYDQFQKALTRIQKDQKTERDRVRLQELRQELDAINKRLAATNDANEREELLRKQRAARREISDIESSVDREDPNKQRTEQLTAYVQSVGQLTDAIVSFWQKANEAEQKSLDKSIELQQKRVDAAQKIAERGNAQYLKEEEDRLQELEIKRENAARRQLAIDTALQASQLLVGITGAIAKISTGVGAAEAIAEIAIIVGALATGYGLVKSLQGNQPTFFVGTKDTGPGGRVDEKGGFPAILHPHEAVFPADKNRDYKPTVEAIFDGKIPPHTINGFVEHYVTGKVKPVPQPAYQKFRDVAEMHVSHDSKLAAVVGDQNKLLMENNDLQRQTLRAMKNMSVSATIDRDGVAISVNEYIEKMLRDKRI